MNDSLEKVGKSLASFTDAKLAQERNLRMTLIHGEWEDEKGKRYHIPAMTSDGGDARALIKTARAMAASRQEKVRRVWAVYERSERIL